MPKVKTAKIKREISAGGLIYKKYRGKIKVVMIKDSYGRWAIPKGNVEKNESKEETALREIKEEVGLKNLKLEKYLGYVNVFYKLHGQPIYKTMHFYLIQTKTLTPLKKSWEIQDARWVDIDQAIKNIPYRDTVNLIKKAKKVLTSKDNNIKKLLRNKI